METYTFLKGRQDNKWCSLKKFDFSNMTKKWDGGSIYLSVRLGSTYNDIYIYIYECLFILKKRVLLLGEVIVYNIFIRDYKLNYLF